MPLPHDKLARLEKLLGMLGSSFDGEVAAAGRAAHALVKGAGLTWGDVLAPAGKPPPAAPNKPAVKWWQEDAKLCLACGLDEQCLSDWEVEFLENISERTIPVTEKQRDKLSQIMDRLGLGG